MMTAAETAQNAIADAIDLLLHPSPRNPTGAPNVPAVVDLLVEALVTLGGDPAIWPEYPEAAARGTVYATRG